MKVMSCDSEQKLLPDEMRELASGDSERIESLKWTEPWMYEVNWCGIYMPMWLLCLILGGLRSVVLGKLVQLILRQTKLLTVDYVSSAVIFAFVFRSVFFGKQ